MRNLKKNKKGFSAIIAALLLMILTVAAGVILYAYVTGWIGGATQGTTVPKGQISIDSMYISSGKFEIYIRNVGTQSETVSQVYVNNVQGTFTLTPTGTITPGSVTKVEITLASGTPASGDKIQVTCTDGTQVSQSYQP
jgi:FlaG/FlaF family flagellin (archaellin)